MLSQKHTPAVDFQALPISPRSYIVEKVANHVAQQTVPTDTSRKRVLTSSRLIVQGDRKVCTKDSAGQRYSHRTRGSLSPHSTSSVQLERDEYGSLICPSKLTRRNLIEYANISPMNYN